MSDEKLAMERRTFLCVLGAASVVAGCGGDDMPAAPFTAGNTSDHAVDVWKLFEAQKVIVGRDAGGYFAYTAVCSHEATTIAFRVGASCATPTGCTSQSTTGLTRCPNHFSDFDGNGTATRGPAVVGSTLTHFQVTVAGGVITVNPGVTVAATARTPAA